MKNKHYIFKDLFNVRDLGGYKTSNNKLTKERRYIRGTARGTLLEEEKEFLYNLGIRTVIDLRMEDEINKIPHPLKDYKDMKYYNIGLTDSYIDGERQNINSLSILYLDLIETAQKEFKKIFDLLALNTKEGVYLSCSAGKDRTGVLVYFLFKIAGVSNKDIIENYSESYQNNLLRPNDGELPPSYYRFMHSNKEEMENFINDVDKKYGSYFNYLNEIGISNSKIEIIRKNLLD